MSSTGSFDIEKPQEQPMLKQDPAALLTGTVDLLDQVGLGVVLCEQDGQILQANEAFARLVGREAADLRGMHFEALTHPDDLEVSLRLREEAAQGRRVFPIEKRYVRPDGEVVWARVRVAPSSRTNGDVGPATLVAVVEDISEQRRDGFEARRNDAHLRDLLAVVGYATAKYDIARRKFIQVDDQFSELTGHSRESLLQMSFDDITYPEDRERERAVVEAVLRGEAEHWVSEKRYLRPTGKTVWVLVVGRLIRDAAGRPWQTVATIFDISERKRAMEALRDSEERSRLVNDSLPVLIAYCDRNEIYRYCNAAYERWFGVKQSDIVGRSVRQIIGEEAYKKMEPRIRAVLGGETVRVEDYLPYARGGGRHVHIQYVPHRRDSGEVLGYYALIENVTADRVARQALEENEAKLRAVVDAAVDGIITIDAQGLVQSINPAAQRMFGYAAEELIGQNVKVLMPAPYYEEHDGYLRNYLETGEAKIIGIGREVTGLRKDGSTFPMDLAVSEARTGEMRLFTGIVRDISERKEGEARLRESEERLKLALEAGRLGTWCWYIQEGRHVWDERQYEITGLKPGTEVNRENFMAHVHPEDREGLGDILKQIEQSGRDAFELEYRAIPQTGEQRWITSRGMLVRDEQGRPLRLVGINIDISERKQAELDVKEAREWFEQIAQATPDVLTVYDYIEKRILYVNHELLMHLGYEPEEIRGATENEIRNLIHPEDVTQLEEKISLLDQLADDEIDENTYRARHKDGTWRWMHSRRVVFSRTPDGQVRQTLSISRDITATKQAEEEMAALRDQLAAELEAMTRLHEFTMRLLGKKGLKETLEEVLDSALQLVGSERGNIQLYDKEADCLRISSHRGFDQKFLNYFAEVRADGSACGQAMKLGRRVLIEDVEEDLEFAPHREIARHSKFRAVASTPLFSRSGEFLGMLSTHFEKPHRPEERELRLIDLYARQAADVIERAQAVEEISKLNEELEQRVAARTALARRQAEQLRWLARKLSQIEQHERYRVADLIHGSLQQLLTAVLMRLDRLQRMVEGEKAVKVAAEMEELVREAIGEARSITNQLSPPVLKHSRLGGALEWLARWSAEKYGLKVHVRIKDDVEPDADLVKVSVFEALRELLFNVVKHAGVMEAEVTLERDDEGHALLTVNDRGDGCYPERWEKPQGTQGGFGLFGMAERLQVVGCEVKYESAPGQGFTARIRLPLMEEGGSRADVSEEQDEGEARTEQAETKTGDPLRVMVVDDHPMVREGFVRLIDEECDMRVVGECSNGAEAVEMAGRLRPDVVMMDISMPVLDGIEATRRIRSDFEDVQVIALTMNVDGPYEEAVRSAGAADYLTKDGQWGEICEKIRRVGRPENQPR